MVSMNRTSNNPYSITFGKAPLEDVAVAAKPMPAEYFNEAGNYVSPAFIEYMKPLAGDIPEFVKLEKIFINR